MHDADLLVCLMGPTGAGKTALAVRLVEDGPFEIVSVDSGMIYRYLDIGTAKPSPAIQARAPHHLIDICEPDERYSAAAFREDAIQAIGRIRKAGRIPLLVGGTGLYFQALLEGLSGLPGADPDVRAELERERREVGAKALHERLRAVDPVTADRIHPNDPQRVQRALEIYTLTGQPMSRLLGARDAQPPPGRQLKLALVPSDRALLHDRIGERYRHMLARGWVNEVRAVRDRFPDPQRLAGLKLVGYREILAYIDGHIDYEEMLLRGIAATRQLAKRQMTWLRRDEEIHWFDTENKELYEKVANLL